MATYTYMCVCIVAQQVLWLLIHTLHSVPSSCTLCQPLLIVPLIRSTDLFERLCVLGSMCGVTRSNSGHKIII